MLRQEDKEQIHKYDSEVGGGRSVTLSVQSFSKHLLGLTVCPRTMLSAGNMKREK